MEGLLGSAASPLLFLDIDGVLRRGAAGPLVRMPLLAVWLEGQPNLGIVISSEWRLTHSLGHLRRMFSPAIAQRVVGITPRLDGVETGGEYLHTRQREIEAWRLSNGHHGRFAALDDDARLFEPDWAHLVHVRGGGVGPTDFEQLSALLAAPARRALAIAAA